MLTFCFVQRKMQSRQYILKMGIRLQRWRSVVHRMRNHVAMVNHLRNNST